MKGVETMSGVQSCINSYLNGNGFIYPTQLTESLEKQYKEQCSFPYIYMIQKVRKFKFSPEKSLKAGSSLKATIQIDKEIEVVFDVSKFFALNSKMHVPSQLTFNTSNKIMIVECIGGGKVAFNCIQLVTISDFFPYMEGKGIPENVEFDILYIGMAYGKNGERSVLERLKNHSTFQKILSEAYTNEWEEDIILSFWEIDPSSAIQIDAKSTIDKDADEKKLMNILQAEQIDMSVLVNMTEAGLIHYFQPEYNIKLKKEFPSKKSKSYGAIYDSEYDAISIEIGMEKCNVRLKTSKNEVFGPAAFVKVNLLDPTIVKSVFSELEFQKNNRDAY